MGRSFADRALALLLANRKGARPGTLQYEFLGYERTLIADAKPGDVTRVHGRVVADGPLLTAPLTGVACVWYRTIVQPFDGYSYRRSAIAEQRGSSLFVDDGSGSARVNMNRARVSLSEMDMDWSHEPPGTRDEQRPARAESVRTFMRAHGTELVYRRTRTVERVLSAWLAPETRAARYREIVLREGERIALLGEIVREPDPATPAARQPSLRVVFGDVPSGVILSNESAAWAG